MSMEADRHVDIIIALNQIDIGKLELLSETVKGFPHGKDKFVERYWITNAIDCGSIETVKWMLTKGVELKFRDDEGYTPLHSSIQRDLPNKYEVFEALIKAGADINAHGPNDYTPLHLAAVNNDQKAMKLLLKAGADKTIRTRIDDRATPEEEARILGRNEAANFLATFK